MKKLLFIICSVVLIWSVITVSTTAQRDENEIFLVSSTAYYDVNHYGHGATGQTLVEGLTLAGPVEWLGYSAMLWDENMDFLGIYEFTDTGYGAPTGRGQSKILKGRSVGTIENGTCIDVYFDTYSACVAWGRKNVYIKLIQAQG